MNTQNTQEPCKNCNGMEWVCEGHLDQPWGGLSDSAEACHCGGAGAPCPVCCQDMANSGLLSLQSELLMLAHQYISDLKYPPTGDSIARRIAAAKAVIAKAGASA
jgi:hypothetical protein